jgi:hypothetical protein
MSVVTGSIPRTVRQKLSERPSILDFGAHGDGRELSDGAIESASQAFSSASSTFDAYYVGKRIWISGAGPSDGVLITTIDAVVDDHTLTLHDAAGTTVADAHAVYGTDNGPALRAAVACERSVFIPKPSQGDFYIVASFDSEIWLDNAVLCYLRSNQEVYGEPGAILKVADGALYPPEASQGGFGLFGLLVDHVYLHDFTLDMNGPYNLTPPSGLFLNWAVAFEGGSHNTVERVNVLDNPGTNCIVSGGIPQRPHPCSFFTVRSCLCRNGGMSIPGNTHQFDFSAIYTAASYSLVEGNTITHDVMPFGNAGGVELHNSNSIATGNRFNYCYPALYIACDIDGEVLSEVAVVDNIMTNCLVGISTFPNQGDGFRSITISRNVARLLAWSTIAWQNPWFFSQPRDDNGYFTSDGTALHGAPNANWVLSPTIEDSELNHNIVSDDTPEPQGSSFARICATKNLHCFGNTLTRFGAEAYQIIGSPFGHTNLSIEGDHITDFGLNTGEYSHQAIGIALSGTSHVPEKAAYDLDGLHVRNLSVNMSSVPEHDASLIFAQWDSGSSVQNIRLGTNWKRNVNGSLITGNNAGSIDYIQTDKAVVLYHKDTNTHRQSANLTWDETKRVMEFQGTQPILRLSPPFGGVVQGTSNPGATPWEAHFWLAAGGGMSPTTPNGHYYYAATTGTTGATEPSWPTTPGATVLDNDVLWVCSTAGEGVPAGFGQWITWNCYFDGANWRQILGVFPSLAFGPNLHLGFAFLYCEAKETDDGIIVMDRVANVDSSGSFNGLVGEVVGVNLRTGLNGYYDAHGQKASFGGTGGVFQGTGQPDPATKAGYGAWTLFNAYFDGADWKQPCGLYPSYGFSSNLHFTGGWTFRHAAANGEGNDDEVITFSEVLHIDATGKMTSPAGIQGGPLVVTTGWGAAEPNANALVIAGGGSGGDSASISWGDGTGKRLWFATYIAGVLTNLLSMKDDGTIDPIKTDLDANRIVKTNSGKVLSAGKVAFTNTDDVDLGTITGGHMLVRHPSSNKVADGGAPIVDGGLTDNSIPVVTSVDPAVLGVALANDIVHVIAAHDAPLLAADLNCTYNSSTITAQLAITTLLARCDDLQGQINSLSAALAAKVDRNIYSVDMIHGTVALQYP